MRSTVLLTLAHAILPQSPCFSGRFLGIFRDGNEFKALHSYPERDVDCLFEDNQLLPDSGHLSEYDANSQLVWLEKSAVDSRLLDQFDPTLYAVLSTIFDPRMTMEQGPQGEQARLQEYIAPQLLYHSLDAALLSLDPTDSLMIDTRLPAYWSSTLVSFEGTLGLIPVPEADIVRVDEILGNLTFNPEIAALVNQLSIPQMTNDIAFLTGESPLSTIVSRHSFAEGSRIAVAWLKSRFEETGAACEFREFLEGFSPDLICRYLGTSNENGTVILGAHYDSRGSFGSTRAPGGDDDGSGITALLAIARIIGSKNIHFHRNVEIVAFSGEEQGLLGSRSYAKYLRDKEADVVLMIQADMLAYHSPDEPMQLGLPDSIGTPSVTYLVGNISHIYSPELTVGYTSACCSDHQSFYEQGYASTQVFERAGPIIDPMYHNSGDLSQREGYDFNQLKAIAKVQFATLLHSAGFESP